MILRILAAIGLIVLIVTFSPIVRWWTGALTGPWPEPKGEVMIVLGSDGNASMIGENSYWRAVYAVHVWRLGGWKEIIVSGMGVAEPIRDFVVSQGVPAAAVRIEGKSGSTRENALFTAALLAADPRSKLLLTSDYHTRRAVRAFRNAGLEVTPGPFPDAGKRAQSWTMRWPVFWELAVETSKTAYYAVRGWL
jgi:uncharacterized SAM-binding protein YcdF (DUF218 family)